ncbi:glycosyltransferase family 2 protein [Candidatus Parcubacteria bacterium]|nr:MAG: glycosyltransferase family 2 protein [Candidatus Parcubacteria bacterium]
MKVDKLSVFFPVYNEEKNISVTVEKAVAVLKKLPLKEYEIILVDDGSKDSTPQVVDELARTYKFTRAVHQENGGYGMALRTGFSNAKYDWIVYTDADGQFDFSQVTKLLDKIESADVVYGYRIKRNDNLVRIVAGWGWKMTTKVLFGVPVKDVDCGFKIVNKKVLDKISPLQSTRGGMINAELVVKARKAGFKIDQVGVDHFPRMSGRSTGVNFKVIVQSYLDLFKLWYKIR